jgi:hypothetical protein
MPLVRFRQLPITDRPPYNNLSLFPDCDYGAVRVMGCESSTVPSIVLTGLTYQVFILLNVFSNIFISLKRIKAVQQACTEIIYIIRAKAVKCVYASLYACLWVKTYCRSLDGLLIL